MPTAAAAEAAAAEAAAAADCDGGRPRPGRRGLEQRLSAPANQRNSQAGRGGAGWRGAANTSVHLHVTVPYEPGRAGRSGRAGTAVAYGTQIWIVRERGSTVGILVLKIRDRTL